MERKKRNRRGIIQDPDPDPPEIHKNKKNLMTVKRHRMSINKNTGHMMPDKESQGNRHKLSLTKRKRHKMSVNKKGHKLSVNKKRHRMSKNKNRHKMSINKIRQQVEQSLQTRDRTAEQITRRHMETENTSAWRKQNNGKNMGNDNQLIHHARWRKMLKDWIKHGGEGQTMTAD